ncbi:Dipeptidyl aminopeptidase/acylaminoacyl peptidase [Sinomicrobium oceani]|uniref:Dipeptidyl aminopeptidase/acylaminoacyl peptidase n=1 Tax=Sinomicrobium oceani TaxID=1150368 RepID=A0A1K1MT97_9FLAO|nr:prolyl oligopeptidase family serine peptidase [Sinomicrobium oceani]SFW26418.1 Dipeptidyl aminopeptidase/acylaminoacyl peptidase [Sinomicrobium oceani]
MFKKITFLLFLTGIVLHAQEQLSVEKIMQDPKWMGTFPSDIRWDDHGETLYFKYNRDNDPSDSLYRIRIKSPGTLEKVPAREARTLIPATDSYNKNRTKKLYTEGKSLFLYDIRKRKKTELIQMDGYIGNPKFLADENKIAFHSGTNLFTYSLPDGHLRQLTHISTGETPDKEDPKRSPKAQWLREENLELLRVVSEREEKKEKSREYTEMTAAKKPYAFYSGKAQVINLELSPNEQFAVFNLRTTGDSQKTVVPDYIDTSGYTTDLHTRTKVGEETTTMDMAVYNLVKDTVYLVGADALPGLNDLPDYTKDYPDKDWEPEERTVMISGASFSPDGKNIVVNVRSKNNKDRWIALLNTRDGSLKNLDRQRDEAWIAGPGIGWSMGGGVLGWLPDNKHIYFQSEETGYSHLYILDITTGKKKALTSGKFEVFDPFLAADGKSWYLTTSEAGPGERHFYTMPVYGGTMKKLTSMTGNNEVTLSPDEKYMAIRYSYSNKPWELYLKKNTTNAKETQLTSGRSEAFAAYPWRDPQLIHFTASDGQQVPARLYVPTADVKNNAAIIFVHGAGYLQNVHKWWSLYFREYMFHNLLADLGYTVLDIDYRGSAGYGRDWRTAIYRHMGGKDLSDQVDGARFLIAEQDINPQKIGIYGGSYGGFITLMAMFNEGDTFTSGAALRSVTDWAHYNHGYTSNILNEPYNDPEAYRKSSPIYFAEGLKGHLLIAHGMVDVNVHFQDVVRLSQRLIELGKDNWEMAVYPAEDHGFVEPSSWTDEYKRILKLFNSTLLEDHK